MTSEKNKLSQSELAKLESDDFWKQQGNKHLDFVRMTIPEIVDSRTKSILPDTNGNGKDSQKEATAKSLKMLIKKFVKSKRLPKKNIMDISVCHSVEYFVPFMSFMLDNWADHDAVLDDATIKMTDSISKTIQYNNQSIGLTQVEQYYQKERK